MTKRLPLIFSFLVVLVLGLTATSLLAETPANPKMSAHCTACQAAAQAVAAAQRTITNLETDIARNRDSYNRRRADIDAEAKDKRTERDRAARAVTDLINSKDELVTMGALSFEAYDARLATLRQESARKTQELNEILGQLPGAREAYEVNHQRLKDEMQVAEGARAKALANLEACNKTCTTEKGEPIIDGGGGGGTGGGSGTGGTSGGSGTGGSATRAARCIDRCNQPVQALIEKIRNLNTKLDDLYEQQDRLAAHERELDAQMLQNSNEEADIRRTHRAALAAGTPVDEAAYRARLKEKADEFFRLDSQRTREVSLVWGDILSGIAHTRDDLHKAERRLPSARAAAERCRKACAGTGKTDGKKVRKAGEKISNEKEVGEKSTGEKSTGGDAEVEVETIHTVDGTNPFDSQKVQDKFTGETQPTGHKNAASDQGGSDEHGSSSGSSGGGGGAVVPTCNPHSVSATHDVGTTACPTPLGVVTVSAGGQNVTISNINKSGSGASRFDVSSSGSGTASPTFSTSFNCSSPAPGTYSIVVTYDATVGGVTTPQSFTASVTVVP